MKKTAVAESRSVAYDRPSFIRRGGAGAWHVLSGAIFLARHASCWPYVLAPAVFSVFFLAAGLFAGVFMLNSIEGRFLPDSARPGEWTMLAFRFGLWLTTLAAATLAGLAVVLFLSAPIMNRLSCRVEQRVRGTAVAKAPSLAWEIVSSFRGSLYFLGAAPLVLLVGLIPILGPPLAALWGSFALAFQQTDPILARRGLALKGRGHWHREWRWESVGFGAGGLLMLPLLNILIAPILTVGATLLVLEIEDGLVP
ncbi:MAG: EI24 domain-containing protein [Vicinamibacteria bacterium]|nr:EI24 domain-containing protein [Vicinamibacteria bacterium]